MKIITTLRSASFLSRLEFWAITTIFAFVVFFHILDVFAWDHRNFDGAPYKHLFEEAGIRFRFYRHYFYPQLIHILVIYLFTLYLNFAGIPRLLTRKKLPWSILILLVVFAVAGLIFGAIDTWLRAYLYAGARDRDAVDQRLIWDGFDTAMNITFVVIVYTAIKYAAQYLLSISESIEAKYRYLRREAIVAGVFWLVGILVLRFTRAEVEFLVGWAIVVPSAIALYLLAFYWLIPKALSRKRFRFVSYFFKSAVILFIAFLIIFMISLFFIRDDDAGAGYSAFNSFFQLFITVPLTWIYYKRQLKENEEKQVLQKELKQSSANYDFLRSQINPHFLFNALNTIYGTAIQENAERTSEGIEKLGDMMRFMLQENVQDKISLAREIDYLNNYISLQKLRTDPNPDIRIDVHVQQQSPAVQIAPMLLIPFVENAFKHGISFRKDSYIKISLEYVDGTLYFDVANSKHEKPENDPEREKSGIGLMNVKQRLQLLYKAKHELVIRETANDFFVHLTLQLHNTDRKE